MTKFYDIIIMTGNRAVRYKYSSSVAMRRPDLRFERQLDVALNVALNAASSANLNAALNVASSANLNTDSREKEGQRTLRER